MRHLTRLRPEQQSPVDCDLTGVRRDLAVGDFVHHDLFLWLVRTTNIIRTPGPPPAPGKLRPYNLGRAQMAFWFFLIYVSYLVIWLITNALDTITASLLGLMGISAGTALSEAMIDSSKDTAQTEQLQQRTAEKESLEQSNCRAPIPS